MILTGKVGMVIEKKDLFYLYAKDDETEDDISDVTEDRDEDEEEDTEDDSEKTNFEI
ncbi:MAG: hypothetical protein Q8Q89_04125 [bacterium]|nr:hypothetical protein [bacterium]